jgi:hypothetical protein
MWLFRNGQPDFDDDCIIFVAMTSTYDHRSLVWTAELCPENYYTVHKL